MNKILVFALCLILVVGKCFAEENSGRKAFLITGKVVGAKLVRRNSTFAADGSYLDAPSTYKFKLKNIRVEQGPSSSFPGSLTIEFDVRDDYPFLQAPQVFVVLAEMGKDRKVLKFGIVSRTACVPASAVIPGYEEHYFPRGEHGAMCVAIDDQYQPPYERADGD